MVVAVVVVVVVVGEVGTRKMSLTRRESVHRAGTKG